MPDKYLVVAPNWLGDAVMALPALVAIRRGRPHDVLAVAARPAIAPLFSMVPGVDEVLTLPRTRGGGPLRAVKAEAEMLAQAGVAMALLFPNSFRSAWALRGAGIPERWGVASDFRARLLTRAVPRPKLPGRHHSEYYAAIADAFGFARAEDDRARLAVPDEARARGTELLEREGLGLDRVLVGMAPGAAYGRAKQWPPRRYAELAAALHERAGAISVLVGSGGDRAAGEEILRRLGPGRPGSPRVVNLIGRTDLPLLVAVMSRCRAFVSNDSGAMHLAAAAGLPVTAPFGSTREKETAPLPAAAAGVPGHAILTADVWCRPCMLRECPIDHRCMTRIPAAAAAEAVLQQIER